MWWMPVAIVYSCNNLLMLWTFCCEEMDNSWIDSMWGMQFIISNLTVIALRCREGTHVITPRMVIATVPIIL